MPDGEKRKRSGKLKWILWGALVAICLILAAVMFRGDRAIIQTLTDQQAAQRWQTEGKPYAQTTIFLEEQDGFHQENLSEMYLNVENALTAGGVPSTEYPWLYAASCTMDGTVSTVNGTEASVDVELTLISGDYFRIHEMKLYSGWYMDKDDVMHDQIVLDRQTAWDLFYSENVAGQYVYLNGCSYIVAAVADLPEGKYNEMAGGKTQRAWIMADSPGITQEGLCFTTIEMVLPQPIDQFAATTIKSALAGFIPDSTLALDNTGRFSLVRRWEVLRTLTTRGIAEGRVFYPYFENAARLAENQLAVRLIPEAILVLIPAVSLLVLLLYLNSRRTWGLHSIRDAVENAIDRRNARNYEAKLRGEDKSKHRKKNKRKKKKKKKQRGKSRIPEDSYDSYDDGYGDYGEYEDQTDYYDDGYDSYDDYGDDAYYDDYDDADALSYDDGDA